MTPPAARRLALSLLLAGLSTLGTLLAVELALRIASGTPFGRPDFEGAIRMVGESYPGMYDPELGYVPRPGAATANVWGKRVVITDDRLRSNGPGPPPRGEPVLVVGDSFAFGDEVNDEETWPAQLQKEIGRPVLNGGVFGYGLDQIVLRAERLLDRTGARTLVVAFVADDVRRCEYVYRYAWKPWFAVTEAGLELHGVPVPKPGTPPPGEALWRRALRWSFLGDLVMRRLDPDGWLLPDSLRVHRQGVSVGRLLVDRLADAAKARGLHLLLVVQWHPLSRVASAVSVADHALERGVPVLPTEALLRREIVANPGGASALFHMSQSGGVRRIGHMTPYGNQVVAHAVARALATVESARAEPGTPHRGS